MSNKSSTLGERKSGRTEIRLLEDAITVGLAYCCGGVEPLLPEPLLLPEVLLLDAPVVPLSVDVLLLV